MIKTKKINFINLIVYFYILLFLLLISYTFYQSEIVHKSEQLSYYYKYYSIFIFGIIFSFLLLFLKKKNKYFFIIVISTIIFLLYFYEIIRFYEKQLLSLNFLKSINNEAIINEELNPESKYSIIQKLKQTKGKNNVVPSIIPKILIGSNIQQNSILPLGGVSSKITVFCKEGEKFSIYTSDRFGFNNPDSQWEEDNLEWLLVGDSFTQGSCVQPGEDIASQIRFQSKQSAISLGMAGNGPLLELAALKEYSIIKKPRNVLWIYFERNDLEDLKKEKSSPILLNYLNNNFTQSLVKKQKEIDDQLNKFILNKEKILKNKKNLINLESKLFAFKKIIRLKIVRDKLSLDRGLDFGVDPIFKETLVNANEYVKKLNGNLFFVYLPDKERYFKKDINDGEYLKRSEVLNLVKNLNIPIIDVHKDLFSIHDDPISFYAHRIYGHYSREGYAKVAEFILENIDWK